MELWTGGWIQHLDRCGLEVEAGQGRETEWSGCNDANANMPRGSWMSTASPRGDPVDGLVERKGMLVINLQPQPWERKEGHGCRCQKWIYGVSTLLSLLQLPYA